MPVTATVAEITAGGEQLAGAVSAPFSSPSVRR